MAAITIGSAPTGGVTTLPSTVSLWDFLLLVMLALGTIKTPLGIPVYFNAFIMLVGILFLVSRQRLHSAYIPLVFLVLAGFIGPLDTGSSLESGIRLMQLLLTIFASMFVARLSPQWTADTIVRLLLPVVLILFVSELVYDGGQFTRQFGGEAQRRLAGLLGEPNFNSALYGVLMLLAFYVGRRWIALAFFVIALFGLSRGFGVAVALWLVALTFNRTRLGGLVFWSAVLVFVAQPFLIWFIDATVSSDTRQILITLSSDRYAHWISYLEMGLSNPWGVGYFQGQGLETTYADSLQAPQAHNVTLQVFSEFGWIGYAFFTTFALSTATKVWKHARGLSPFLLYLLVVYSFLNALSEWGLWVGIGILHAAVASAQLPRTATDNRLSK